MVIGSFSDLREVEGGGRGVFTGDFLGRGRRCVGLNYCPPPCPFFANAAASKTSSRERKLVLIVNAWMKADNFATRINNGFDDSLFLRAFIPFTLGRKSLLNASEVIDEYMNCQLYDVVLDIHSIVCSLTREQLEHSSADLLPALAAEDDDPEAPPCSHCCLLAAAVRGVHEEYLPSLSKPASSSSSSSCPPSSSSSSFLAMTTWAAAAEAP